MICLFVLTSSAFGLPSKLKNTKQKKKIFILKFIWISAYGGGYGSAPYQSVPQLLVSMRDQGIQQPLVPTLPVPTQTYGHHHQQQPLFNQWSTP